MHKFCNTNNNYYTTNVLCHDYLDCNVIDIDECNEGSALCEQNCSNNNGSYTCSCKKGFIIETDGISCTGMLSSTGTVMLTQTHNLVF